MQKSVLSAKRSMVWTVTSPTSSNFLEQLLPGNDPAQPVPRASAVIHSQADIPGLQGHNPKTPTAFELQELLNITKTVHP